MSDKRMISLLIVLLLILNVCQSQGGEIKQIIKLEEVLAKIKNREPVDYSSVIIKGDVYLSCLNSSIPSFIDSPLRIVDSEIESDIYFNGSIFNRTVNFEHTKFKGITRFDGATFEDYANFGESFFNKSASFSEARFKDSANFWNSRFNGSTTFKKSDFFAPVDFHRSEFRDIAIFNFANFNGYETYFENSGFYGIADFRQAEFEGNAIFVGAVFKESADFTGSKFNLSSDFIGSRFDKTLFLRKIKFNILNIDWSSIRDKLISDEPGYILLIRNFKDLGQFDDADNYYYEYREWKRNNRPLNAAKLFDSLAWFTCGYGVRWFHPIFSGFLVIIAFGIYYDILAFDSLIVRCIFRRKSFRDLRNESIEGFKRTFLFSMISLLSLPPEWYPYGKEEYAKFIKNHLFSAIAERLIGYGLMLLLIGTLTRLMVRYS